MDTQIGVYLLSGKKTLDVLFKQDRIPLLVLQFDLRPHAWNWGKRERVIMLGPIIVILPIRGQK